MQRYLSLVTVLTAITAISTAVTISASVILCLYEHSGTFSDIYRAKGYEVVQVDQQLDGSDVRLMKHLKGKRVKGILAFPPCTHLANSGAWCWPKKGDAVLIDALSMVDAALRMVAIYEPDFWLIENPVGRLKHYIGEPSHRFHPWHYAGYANDPKDDAYTKLTCLWGRFNIPDRKDWTGATDNQRILFPKDKDGKFLRYISPEAKNIRSKTPEGFARAFASVNGRSTSPKARLHRTFPIAG